MYEDDEYNEAMMRAYYEKYPIPELTPLQLKQFRNHCEKNFRKAKIIVWTFENHEWKLQLKYAENINFEI